MSWLFKSFQSDGSDSSESHQFPTAEHSPSSSSSGNPGGVKEDLSVLGQTLTRQFRGVANFLAPPPPAITTTTVDSSQSSLSSSSPKSPTLLGIRNDLVEIGGSFKTSLSLLSGNKAVSEISRIASNLLQFQDEDRDEASGNDDEDGIDGVPGVTDEVLDFVSEISNRLELWTDFPLPFNNDFNMSDAQKEHASTIEHLAPSMAALRVKLQSSMSDEQFWMIYFILLLPRLSEHDFELLSTSKIVEARDVLLQKLQRNAQVENENFRTLDTSQEGSKASETQGENMPSQENKVSVEIINADDEENTEKWVEEEDTDTGTLVDPQKKLEHEEDVSFSDLGDDDNDLSSRQSGLKPAQDVRASSPNGSNDWVQLNESSETRGGQQKAGLSNSQEKDSEGEESNDWLKVDDFD